MINQQLLNPKSIVIVGGSNSINKPGGKVLKNLIDNKYKGTLHVVNKNEIEVQGIKAFRDVKEIPDVDLAIIAIAAKYCLEVVETLAKEKNTRAFIILSAGFSEENKEGAILEKQIVETVNSVNGCLIGPNCIGFLNSNYTGVFTTPIPKLEPFGCDLISGSGATAVFIIESAMPKGLTFSSVVSVGNSAQIDIEEMLQYMDETYNPETSSSVKILYIEDIKKPEKLLKHASSLILKGCKIAAIKSGSSEAGVRAASSHTGALASPDIAVDALFRKAGIVRCYGRHELTTVASIFMYHELKGKRIAIITHAGGPAVMLTDVLSKGGLEVPQLKGIKPDELLTHLYPGSSISNPIDFLATGTAEQLGKIIDYCEEEFFCIDAMIVIFGSPGLFEVFDVYKVLNDKMNTCKKPIYPILPSIINGKNEITEFISREKINFPDEILFGNALTKVFFTPKPVSENEVFPKLDDAKIREVINSSSNGYLKPAEVQLLLDAAGISRAGEVIVKSANEAIDAAKQLGFPVVMKVVGPVHKSDVGGVVLNVINSETVALEFERMFKIKDATSVMLQPMLSGTELFIGAKKEGKFGHLVLCGLGGIFIEVLKDVSSGLAPLSINESLYMIHNLKSYNIIKGVRGQEGVNEDIFADFISRISVLVKIAPEISEMDLNPLLGKKDRVVAVDARIRIEK